MTEFQVGQRVIVSELQYPTFDDYDVGDTAVITEVVTLLPNYTALRVRWEKPRYQSSKQELDRCNTLYSDEVELLP